MLISAFPNLQDVSGGEEEYHRASASRQWHTERSERFAVYGSVCVDLQWADSGHFHCGHHAVHFVLQCLRPCVAESARQHVPRHHHDHHAVLQSESVRPHSKSICQRYGRHRRAASARPPRCDPDQFEYDRRHHSNGRCQPDRIAAHIMHWIRLRGREKHLLAHIEEHQTIGGNK